ncbi:MAG: ABC transporter ATP-binding protein [Actinobacteria bacterium HGW-Actinobacteria-10]|jgi:Fe-S cluster assembly ATP-binding protein|nr:MAG: ABC transporter ATP-binding protein [Actinobacteria bacterium HGW-Actinobacteria-10]
MSTDEALLDIRGLHVNIGEREVLKGIDLAIDEGETHVLLGPNGGGKTTLLNTILGIPGYVVTAGSITFKGHNLLELEIDERARLGIGVAFQRPPAVRGVKLRQMIEVASRGQADEARVAELAQELNLGYMLDRDVNMGFSGGEAKRAEMGQLLAQRPDLALFDEPESGVDLDNIAVVGGAINELLKGARVSQNKSAGLIITHTGHILEFVNADVGHVLYNGRLACKGNARDLIGEISHQGYEKCVECALCQQ